MATKRYPGIEKQHVGTTVQTAVNDGATKVVCTKDDDGDTWTIEVTKPD